MTVSATFQKTPETKTDTVIVGIYKDNRLTPSAEALDKENGGLIQYSLKNQKKFMGKQGVTLSLALPQGGDYNRILLIGLGDPAKLDAGACETIGGKLYMALSSVGAVHATLLIDSDQARENCSAPAMAAHIVMGAKLRSYSFDRYKSKKDDEVEKFENIEVVTDEARQAHDLYETLDHVGEGMFLARDLVNDPPNELYPESFARIIKEELKPLGVDIEIFDDKKMEKLGFHAHLAVGMGSVRLPRVVIMRWNGADKKDSQPLAFVGKGVTFDTGGVNIKPTGGMEEMKLDMGGAAAVVGLMKSLALRKAAAHVVGIVGLAENMPSHMAYRPSDVLQSMSGKTVEVMNTDAEGRLVLADCLTYVQRTYTPRLVIDLATLTGAMMVALGTEYCGTFVNDNEMWEQMAVASKESGEKLWRMPLDEAFRKEMDSTIADIKTLGTSGRYAGACTAAGFLQRFIEGDTPWAHMDIAGTAWVKKDTAICPKPATGFGVRILDRFIANNYED